MKSVIMLQSIKQMTTIDGCIDAEKLSKSFKNNSRSLYVHTWHTWMAVTGSYRSWDARNYAVIFAVMVTEQSQRIEDLRNMWHIDRFAIFAVHNCSTASQKIPSIFAVVKSPRIFDLIWLSIRPARSRDWFEAHCQMSSSLSWNGTWSRVRAFLYVSTPVNRSSMYRSYCDGGCRYREVSLLVFRKLQQTFCGEIRRWRQPDCV